MKNINDVIKSIKTIDKLLDKYEYSGIPYEEYVHMKEQNKRGNRSMRKIVLYGSGGRHLWASYYNNTFDELKKYINTIYKNNENINYDIEIKLMVGLKEIRDQFNKDIDKYGLFPLESEEIKDNINIIIKNLNV